MFEIGWNPQLDEFFNPLYLNVTYPTFGFFKAKTVNSQDQIPAKNLWIVQKKNNGSLIWLKRRSVDANTQKKY